LPSETMIWQPEFTDKTLSRKPGAVQGMDTKTASDYLPQTNWPTTQLPPGYTCAEPYLFPDINKPDGPATAGIDDLGEILAKMKQRTSRGIRK
ncbi:hypothetical protein OSK71_14070, partial [Escherichia coli]|nr:hypothetical protein [Escherichia coli]